MPDYSRTQRIGDQIQRELASLIQLEVKDPRVGMVMVNEVEVSRDLAYADVHVTGFGADDEASQQALVLALNHAAGFLRSRLAQLIRLRIVPKLRFHYDQSVVRGRRLSALIDRAIEADHAQSGGKEFGDHESGSHAGSDKQQE